MSFLKDVLKSETRSSNLPVATSSTENIEDNGEDDCSLLSVLESESQSVHSAHPSSSVSSADAVALQPAARRKKRLRPEVESLITKNEEIIALEKRKLDILDTECARAECACDLLLFLKSLLPHIKSLPRTTKLCLRSTFQDLLIQELEQVKNSSRLSSDYSPDVSNLNHQPEDLPCHGWMSSI
jgi:hypothetical protein